MTLRICGEVRHRKAKPINEGTAKQSATMDSKIKLIKAKQRNINQGKATPIATKKSKANNTKEHTRKAKQSEANQNKIL